MTGQDNIIELRGVDKSFEDTRALEGIDLSISNGEFLTLLGPSGCGKTTILRILSGFETPDQGDVSIGGQRMNDVPPERRQVNTRLLYTSDAADEEDSVDLGGWRICTTDTTNQQTQQRTLFDR